MAIPDIERYLDRLKSPSEQHRQKAASRLVKMGATAVPALIEAIQDRDENVRRHAMSALGKIGDASAVPALIASLLDRGSSVRRYAALALGEIGDASAVPALIEAIQDSHWDVRRFAVEALGRFGDAPAVSALLGALYDSEWFVRSHAAEALNRLGDARALPRKALADPRLSPPEKIALLEAMRNVRYSEAGVTLRYPIPDLYRFCQSVVNEGDEEERAGAQAVLDYLNHVRPAERDPSREAQTLLRPAQGGQDFEHGEPASPFGGAGDARRTGSVVEAAVRGAVRSFPFPSPPPSLLPPAHGSKPARPESSVGATRFRTRNQRSISAISRAARR
jgi:hypothetical protein